ncbi:MAG: hypothetical protein KBH01_06760 [Breznakibacter sp.]|nr:hypothetical protein [Breznakibacter sp.]
MRIAKSLIAVVGMFCLIVSCSKSEDVEYFMQGGAGADLKVIGRSFDLKSSVAKLSYTKVQAGFKEIVFKHEDSDGVTSDVVYNGSYHVDLLTGVSTPKMTTANLKAGKYVGFQAAIAPGANNPSFLCEVEYVNAQNQKLRVEFETNKQIDISYSSRVGFIIKEGDVYTFLLTFILPTLFDGVDMETAQVTDGTIYVSSTANADLAVQIEKNISKAVDYAYQINGVSLPF